MFLLHNLEEGLEKGFKFLVIVRGLPGRGKSTLAKHIEKQMKEAGYRVIRAEADDYFTDENGNYNYNASFIRNAHDYCNKRLASAMERGHCQVVIQSNTNVQPWESETLRGYASRYNYIPITVMPKYAFAKESDIPEDLRETLVSTHNVSSEKIGEMQKKVKGFPLAYLGFFTYGSTLFDQIMALEDVPYDNVTMEKKDSLQVYDVEEGEEEEEEGERAFDAEGLPDDDDDDEDDEDDEEKDDMNRSSSCDQSNASDENSAPCCLSPRKQQSVRRQRERESKVASLVSHWQREATKQKKREEQQAKKGKKEDLETKKQEEEEEDDEDDGEEESKREEKDEQVVTHETTLNLDERMFHVTTDFVMRKINKDNQSVFQAVSNDCGNLNITLKIVALFKDSLRGIGAIVYSDDSPMDIDNETIASTEGQEQTGERTSALSEEAFKEIVFPKYFNPKDLGFSTGQERWGIPHYRRITGAEEDIPPHMTIYAQRQAKDIGLSARELLAVAGQAPNVRHFKQHLLGNFPDEELRSEPVCQGVVKVHIAEKYTETKGVEYEVLLFDEPLEVPAIFAAYYGPAPQDFHKFAHNTWSFKDFRKRITKMWRKARELQEGTKRSHPPKKIMIKAENEIINQLLAHPNVKDVAVPVPEGILPFEADLHDISIGKARFMSDDVIYESEEMLRKCLPRGLSLLERKGNDEDDDENDDGEEKASDREREPKIMRILNGYGKFTGYEDSEANEAKESKEGSEDEEGKVHPLEASKINKYFTKDIAKTVHIMATEKANGEAAHVSSFEIEHETFVVVGSKTVHMILRRHHLQEDLEKYRLHNQRYSRFDYALNVGQAFIEALESVSEKGKNWFFSFLNETRFTAVWELENPASCHIVPITVQRLKFIGFAQYAPVSSKGSWIALKPEPAFNWMSASGFTTVWWFKQLSPTPVERVEDVEALLATLEDEIMQENRFPTEGCVLNFIDKTGSVIGLVKAKNARYITSRAIRQRMFHFMKQIKPRVLFPVRKLVNRLSQMMGRSNSPIQRADQLKQEILSGIDRDIVKAVESSKRQIERRLVELTTSYVKLTEGSRDEWIHAACLMAESIGDKYRTLIQNVLEEEAFQRPFNDIIQQVEQGLAIIQANQNNGKKGKKGKKDKKGNSNDKVPQELKPFENFLQELYNEILARVEEEGLLEASVSAQWPFRWNDNLEEHNIDNPRIEMRHG